MKTIVADNGVVCHSDFKLLPKDFLAITLFGHVFFNETYEWLEKYLKSYYGQVTMNHEYIHILQSKTFFTRYLGFYIVYLWYWIIGLFKYGCKDHSSYNNIPFEREAYINENNFEYKESNWKAYV